MTSCMKLKRDDLKSNIKSGLSSKSNSVLACFTTVSIAAAVVNPLRTEVIQLYKNLDSMNRQVINGVKQISTNVYHHFSDKIYHKVVSQSTMECFKGL